MVADGVAPQWPGLCLSATAIILVEKLGDEKESLGISL
jgi:hypothetical protein